MQTTERTRTALQARENEIVADILSRLETHPRPRDLLAELHGAIAEDLSAASIARK